MMDYGYAGWTRDENFLKVRMNFCSDELEESVLLLVFVIQRQNERYFCVVFGLATFTDCTPGGLIPEILNTNTNTLATHFNQQDGIFQTFHQKLISS